MLNVDSLSTIVPLQHLSPMEKSAIEISDAMTEWSIKFTEFRQACKKERASSNVLIIAVLASNKWTA